jgi:phosphatidylinositol alpha-1,6-mannosyltransferase
MMSDFEPMGIVFIEAYCAGLPVVAYDSGSRSEIVLNGKTGVLCADRTPQTIADALHHVISDSARRDTMAEEARRLAANVFTWDHVVEKIGRVLSAPANGRQSEVPNDSNAPALAPR